jgi:hypothetical protein
LSQLTVNDEAVESDWKAKMLGFSLVPIISCFLRLVRNNAFRNDRANGSTKSTQDQKKNSLVYPKVETKQSGPQDMHIIIQGDHVP